MTGSQPPEKPLLAVVGPTASGKSALGIALALALNAEIVCCDAVTVYRGLEIGANKPSAADRAAVPHHALDLLDPTQPTDAGLYARAARAAIVSVTARDRLPILVGGSGLYLRATLEGLAPAPPRNETLRERLRLHEARHGIGALHRLLHRWDPAAAERIHPNDQPKLIRSLEIALLAPQPANQTAQWTTSRSPLPGFHPLILALDPPRAALHERINHRAAAMFADGLLAEAAILQSRFGADAVALRSLGYKEALAHLRGELPLPDAIAQTQAGHRQYAKRQLTWFRNQTPAAHWLRGFGDEPAILQQAQELVTSALAQP